MKALIWIGCFLGTVIVNILLLPLELRLGYMLMYANLFVLPSYLCKKLDLHRAMKAVKESGMSVNEYAKQGLSDDFVAQLPNMAYEKMKSVLKAKKKEGSITHEQYVLLLKLCSWTHGKDKCPKL